jgi:hypothetical protein
MIKNQKHKHNQTTGKNMKTQFITDMENILKETEEKKFLGLYKSYLNLRRSHFVEFALLKKVSIINEINELMEEEMNCRNGIEKLALEKVSDTEILIKGTEKIKKEWTAKNEIPEETSMKSDFKKIVMYVAAFHICLISSFVLYNVFTNTKNEDNSLKNKEELSEVFYGNPVQTSKNKQLGPKSDALSKG